MDGIDIWNDSDLETRQQICVYLGWPTQYADGEANHEWLTDEQYDLLSALREESLTTNKKGTT